MINSFKLSNIRNESFKWQAMIVEMGKIFLYENKREGESKKITNLLQGKNLILYIKVEAFSCNWGRATTLGKKATLKLAMLPDWEKCHNVLLKHFLP